MPYGLKLIFDLSYKVPKLFLNSKLPLLVRLMREYEKLGFNPTEAILALGTATTICPVINAFLTTAANSGLSLSKTYYTLSIF